MTWRETASVCAGLLGGLLSEIFLWWFTNIEIVGLTFISVLVSIFIACSMVIGEEEQ